MTKRAKKTTSLVLVANGVKYRVTGFWFVENDKTPLSRGKARLVEVVEGTIHNGDVVTFEDAGRPVENFGFVVEWVKENAVGLQPYLKEGYQ